MYIDRKNCLWQKIYHQTCQTRVIDSHSHLLSESEYEKCDPKPGLFTLQHYVIRELANLEELHGLRLSSCKTDEERWVEYKKFLELAGNVSYFTNHWQTFRDLYGLGNVELNDSNWKEIHQKIQESSRRPGWYRKLIKNIAGIDLGVRTVPSEDVPSTLTPQVMVTRKEKGQYHVGSVSINDLFRFMKEPPDKENHPISRLGRLADIEIRNSSNLEQAVDKFLEIIKSEGAVAIKASHAYSRSLFHQQVTAQTATNIIEKLLSSNQKPNRAELTQLEDFIFWQFCEKCGDHNLVFQIHTGLQGNWSNLPYSDPRKLLNVISTFRKTKFDLFHAGYPFTIELGVMAKHYPNIWANMAWMYIITMEGSRRTLDEWIDLVPGHRIIGFGSDLGWPELVVGHLTMARMCIADVLTKKVMMDMLTEQRAMILVRQMLRDNAIALYSIEDHPSLSGNH